MKKLLCLLAIATTVSSLHAQQYKEAAPSATYAYAKGDDSYIIFSDHFNAEKKYVVLKLYNDSDPLTDREKTDLAFLTKFLQKKNIEVATINWKDEAALQEAMKKYEITASSKDNKHLNLHSGQSSLNTTSSKAILMLQDGRPLSLCSGTNCEDNVKRFFGLQSSN